MARPSTSSKVLLASCIWACVVYRTFTTSYALQTRPHYWLESEDFSWHAVLTGSASGAYSPDITIILAVQTIWFYAIAWLATKMLFIDPWYDNSPPMEGDPMASDLGKGLLAYAHQQNDSIMPDGPEESKESIIICDGAEENLCQQLALSIPAGASGILSEMSTDAGSAGDDYQLPPQLRNNGIWVLPVVKTQGEVGEGSPV